MVTLEVRVRAYLIHLVSVNDTCQQLALLLLNVQRPELLGVRHIRLVHACGRKQTLSHIYNKHTSRLQPKYTKVRTHAHIP